MNEWTIRERMLKLSPLVLRLGLAAVLVLHGFGQVNGLFAGDPEQQLVADAAGINVKTGWDTVLGFAEIGAGGMLALGLLTRLVNLALLGGAALWAKGALFAAGGTASVSDVLNGQDPALAAMLLLAAVSVSLLVSGCGCLGLDCRLFGRKKQTDAAAVA